MIKIPRDLDAERWTLGAMLLDNNVIDDVAMVLRPEDFHLADHETICRAIFNFRDEGKPANSLTMSDLLESMSHDRFKLGMFDALLDSVPHAVDVVHHAKIVRDKAVKRELIVQAQEILTACQADQESASRLVEQAEAGIFALAERETTGDTIEAYQAVDMAIERAEVRESGHFNGVTTGLVDLDETLDGFRPGQLILLAARPGAGKTALALNIALESVLVNNKAILFVSMEMDRIELADRILACWGKIDGKRIREGLAKSPGEKLTKQRVRQELYEKSFGIDDASLRTIGQISANARRRARRNSLSLLIIDYIQLIETQPGKNESREEQVAKMSRRLKMLAKDLNIPILALSQLNRNSENREDRKPRLADLRESGALEQDADVVLLLHRPELFDENDRPGQVELIISKNRSGPTGTIPLTYLKQFTRFENFYPAEAPNQHPANGAAF